MSKVLSRLDNPIVFVIATAAAVLLPLYLFTMVLHKLSIPGPATLLQ